MFAHTLAPRLMDTRFLTTSDGVALEYLQTGAGEPLVLLPSLAGGLELARPLVDALAKRYRVTALAWRGETSVLRPQYRFDRFVEDVAEAMQQLRLERPALCGLSFGGAVALEFACQNPGTLSHLITQGAGPVYRPGLFGRIAAQALERFDIPTNNPHINKFFQLLLSDQAIAGPAFETTVRACWRTEPGVIAQRLRLLEQYDITDRLWTLEVPTLVLGAEHDILFPLDEARQLAEQLPRAHFGRLRDAGHFAFVTHPQEIVQRITRFEQAAVGV